MSEPIEQPPKARPARKGYTAKQRGAYEMRKSGHTWEEIGAAFGCTGQSARGNVAAAIRNGLPPLPKRSDNAQAERVNPEAAGIAMLAGVDESGVDLAKIREMAEAAGIPSKMANGLVRRIQTNYASVTRELRVLKAGEMIARLNEKVSLALDYLDETVLAAATAKDLAFVIATLIDKAQLLGGKPTAIYDFNSRKKLEELMPQFLAEAKRRGITVEGTFTHVVEPEPKDLAVATAGEPAASAVATVYEHPDGPGVVSDESDVDDELVERGVRKDVPSSAAPAGEHDDERDHVRDAAEST